MIEKLKADSISFKILVHNSKKTLHTDMIMDPHFHMKPKKSMLVQISTKTNLNAISTLDSPCALDETLPRKECSLKMVGTFSYN